MQLGNDLPMNLCDASDLVRLTAYRRMRGAKSDLQDAASVSTGSERVQQLITLPSSNWPFPVSGNVPKARIVMYKQVAGDSCFYL
jgi:hypothetical protein